MAPVLAAAGVLLGFAAIRELYGLVEEPLAPRLRRAFAAGAARPSHGVGRLAGAAAGAATALVAAPVAPERLRLAIAGLFVAAGLMAPAAVAARRERRRRERFVAALPDALDLLAVGSAAGKGAVALFGEIAGTGAGPLASELARTLAAVECGAAPREALAALRQAVPGAEVAAFTATLERSRAYGSPLAEQLYQQATALRRDARRRIEERAARAAPKIQLVVALVLVPSVLLVILAAIIAHADALLAGV